MKSFQLFDERAFQPSRVHVYHSVAEMSTIGHFRISDRDLGSVLGAATIISEVRAEIVARIVDRVMARLAPAIDRALSETAEGQQP